jgi:hypothetical protein
MRGDQLGDTNANGKIILKFILKMMWLEITQNEL